MNKKNKKQERGFTLIELLVVIAIIGLLSSVVMASMTEARNKAKQSQIDQSILVYVRALDAFYADNGYYPDPEDYDSIGEPYCLGDIPNTPSGCWSNYWEGYEEAGFRSVMSEYVASWQTPQPYDFPDSGGSGAIFYPYNCVDNKCQSFDMYWSKFDFGGCPVGNDEGDYCWYYDNG